MRLKELVPADQLPRDPSALRSACLGDLPLDSLDLLTLAMKLEDDIGRVIEMDAIDESLSVSELAAELSVA